MDTFERISESLDRIGAMGIDPTAEIYRRLFAARPDLEALFVLDIDGAARGNMLAKALDCLLDLAGPRAFGAAFILAEAINHEGIGVTREAYLHFFECIADVVRETNRQSWSDADEEAWRQALNEVCRLLASPGV